MKVAWSAFVLDGGVSGISTYVLSLLQALSRVDQNNSYDILVPSQAEAMLPSLSEKFRVKSSWSFVDHPMASILWHNSVLPALAMSCGYDLVHIPSIRRIPVVKGSRLVATVHDMAPCAMPEKYDEFRWFYHQHVLARLIHRCDRVIAVSQYTKADIIKFTGYPEEKIDVIYSGIDQQVFRPHVKDGVLRERYGIDGPFFVYVSRVEYPAKNHLNLIRAFELLKQKHDLPHELVLAGPDWSGSDVVRDYIQHSSMGKQIHLLGAIPTEDVVRLYSECDVMVFPSLFEGFGFPFLEALACGALVACSNVTALKELAEGYAQLFNPQDPESIAQAILATLELGDKESLRARGREYAATFDWDKTARKVLETYRRAGEG